VIRLEEVGLKVGGFELDNVSLDIPAGGYGLIIGPTGSGKTSLLEAVAGHVRLKRGRITLDGRDVTNLAPESRGVGFVYQAYHLFPHCSVAENIGYGLRESPPETRRARVNDLAGMLGIAPLLERGIEGLSGGEQQRVALARALAPRPSILLLDEPFAAVDPALRRVLRRELMVMREREGVTTLHVTHDVDDALRLGDVVAVLGNGGVVQSGPPEHVFRFPNSPFVAHFLGSGSVLKGMVTATGPAEGEPPRFPARFVSGSLALDVIAEREGEAHAVIRPEDLLVSKAPFDGYPRNRFDAVVRRVERIGPVANVHLEVNDIPLFAAVTTATVDAQGIAAGDPVHLALKATAVHLL
jgi:ABC-type Fe3+/spermidine/putrescine transport system ATPase subunit